MKALIPNVVFLLLLLICGCQERKSRFIQLRFPNDFQGAFTFAVDPKGVDVREDSLLITVPPNGVIRVKSLEFLYEWRHQKALRANGIEIPSFNDEPYNAQKVGVRVVYADDAKFVFMIGTQAECDALQRLGDKSVGRGTD